MPGKPMLLKDLDRMRPGFDIAPFDRVRVIIGAGENHLDFDLECVACEALLEWVSPKGWWVCPECGEETTDREGARLLRACYEGLKEIVGDTDEASSGELQDAGKGLGRWLRTVTGISKR